MKRLISVALMVGLVAASMVVPAEAKKKKKKAARVERVVEVPYTGGGLGVASPAASGGFCRFSDPAALECDEIPTTVTDRYVKIELKDASGLKQAGFISQGDVDGDGIGDLFGDFCGAHTEPVELLSPGANLRVSFYNGTCMDGTPSVVTTGVIVATFSNMP